MFFSSKWLYFTALLLISLSKTSAMRSSVVKAKNFAGTTSLTSLFLFPVTFANSLLSAFASRKFFNERDSAIGINFAINATLEQTPQRKKFNKRRSVCSSKYGNYFAYFGSDEKHFR